MARWPSSSSERHSSSTPRVQHAPHGLSAAQGQLRTASGRGSVGVGRAVCPAPSRARPASPAAAPAWLHFHALPSVTQAPSGGGLAKHSGGRKPQPPPRQIGAAAARAQGASWLVSLRQNRFRVCARRKPGLQSGPNAAALNTRAESVSRGRGERRCHGCGSLAPGTSGLRTFYLPSRGWSGCLAGRLEEGPWERRGHVLQGGFCTGLVCIFRKSCTKLGQGQLKGRPSVADSGVGSYSAASSSQPSATPASL